MNKVNITLKVNNKKVSKKIEPRLLLADFLRECLDLTGTHLGCEHGVCGACSVLVDQKAIRSCLMFAIQADGKEIITVESLKNKDYSLNKLQESFSKNHALQCGFCTPGFLITLTEFMNDNSNPSESEIREAISGNICRCTGYSNIVKAVKEASE